jgi:hypothetical protein
MVWKLKTPKEGKKQKKVTFADPIAVELKLPKQLLPDDSIMLIKGNHSELPNQSSCSPLVDVLEVDFLMLPNHSESIHAELELSKMQDTVEEANRNAGSVVVFPLPTSEEFDYSSPPVQKATSIPAGSEGIKVDAASAKAHQVLTKNVMLLEMELEHVRSKLVPKSSVTTHDNSAIIPHPLTVEMTQLPNTRSNLEQPDQNCEDITLVVSGVNSFEDNATVSSALVDKQTPDNGDESPDQQPVNNHVNTTSCNLEQVADTSAQTGTTLEIVPQPKATFEHGEPSTLSDESIQPTHIQQGSVPTVPDPTAMVAASHELAAKVASPRQRSNGDILTHAPTVDDFLESLVIPLQQPLIQEGFHTPHPQAENCHSPPQTSTQRKSTRLAKKAELNIGKDTIQVAQDLLIKKLGDLVGEKTNQDEADFDFYAQHFERPIDKTKMEAIQMLIEQGNRKTKKSTNRKRMATQVGLEA